MPEKSDVLFLLSYLPPLSDFVLTLLDPPSPPKIGHHLCTFPYHVILRTMKNVLSTHLIQKLAKLVLKSC